MENPATWDELDKAVDHLITQYHLDADAGVIGLSLTRTIADFIRERDKAIDAATESRQDWLRKVLT